MTTWETALISLAYGFAGLLLLAPLYGLLALMGRGKKQ